MLHENLLRILSSDVFYNIQFVFFSCTLFTFIWLALEKSFRWMVFTLLVHSSLLNWEILNLSYHYNMICTGEIVHCILYGDWIAFHQFKMNLLFFIWQLFQSHTRICTISFCQANCNWIKISMLIWTIFHYYLYFHLSFIQIEWVFHDAFNMKIHCAFSIKFVWLLKCILLLKLNGIFYSAFYFYFSCNIMIMIRKWQTNSWLHSLIFISNLV